MTDDPLTRHLLLAGSAFAAGMVNSVAGGGTLLTFPALVGVLGPEGKVAANVTSTIALLPGSMAGAWGYRAELAAVPRWAWILVWPSLIGGLAGSIVLLNAGEKVFGVVVPWLILTATLLLLFQPVLASRLTGGHDRDVAPVGRALWLSLGFQLMVGLYGGYFGAGIGILMLASLGLLGIGDIHHNNALKTVLASLINAISVVVFLADGSRIVWSYGAVMAVAAVAGGFTGARVARRLNKSVVRWTVVVIGFALSVYYFGFAA